MRSVQTCPDLPLHGLCLPRMLLAPNGGQSLGLGPHTLPASPHRAHPPPEHLASQKHIGEKGPGWSQTGETNNTEGRKKRRKGRQLISSFSCLKLSITGVTPAPTQTKDNCRGLGFIPWGWVLSPGAVVTPDWCWNSSHRCSRTPTLPGA